MSGDGVTGEEAVPSATQAVASAGQQEVVLLAEGRWKAARLATVSSIVTLMVLVSLAAARQVSYVIAKDRLGDDFGGTIWHPARNVVHGVSPYADGTGFAATSVYPPPVVLAATPLGVVRFAPAAVVWTILLVAAAILVLGVLGVRDLRCYVLWLSSIPVVADVALGNITMVVILCGALCWRYRDSSPKAAAALTAAIAIKLFLAPLWFWFVLTRRFRAAAYSAIAVPALLLLSWAVIGFKGLLDYPRLLSDLASEQGSRGVLLHAFLRQIGFGRGIATAAALGCAAVCVALAAAARSDEVACFALLLLAALLATPVAWVYYPGLLVIPLALRWPRAGVFWLFLPVLWVSWAKSPLHWATPQLSLTVLGLVVGLVGLVVYIRPRGVNASRVAR